MFDRVTPVQKQEARDLIRLAKRRGFRLSLTKDQLNDPKCVGRFFAIYGDPPSHALFNKAAGIAKYLKVKLTVEQAMNKWHCKKFIGESRGNVPGGMPSEAQIELAGQLADYHRIDVPDAVRISLDDWNAFFQKYLGREERDTIQELAFQLQSGSFEIPSPPVFVIGWPFIGEPLYDFFPVDVVSKLAGVDGNVIENRWHTAFR